MDNLLKELELEHKSELMQMKLRWEGIKLAAEKEKLEHPELSDKIDNYLLQLQSVLHEFLTEIADEEEKEELLADEKYIFGD